MLLPICQSSFGVTGLPPPYRVLPAVRLMFSGCPWRLMLSEIAEMCSIFERAPRYRSRSRWSEARTDASDVAAAAGTTSQTAGPLGSFSTNRAQPNDAQSRKPARCFAGSHTAANVHGDKLAVRE